MIIGALSVEATLFEAMTLKDKRRIVKGVKERLRNRFNVAVAEVGHTDSPKRTTLAIVTVADDSRFVHSVLDKTVDAIRSVAGLTLIDYDREIL
ncbi:MAG: DUF503 domain-containing protein [Planctomycetota bacterium]|jgi:uncharacterized protein YlxP (DUF503 family)